jgi:hypothetical protein
MYTKARIIMTQDREPRLVEGDDLSLNADYARYEYGALLVIRDQNENKAVFRREDVEAIILS